MAKQSNLRRDFTPEERRINGRKGAEVTNQKIRQRKLIRDIVLDALDTPQWNSDHTEKKTLREIIFGVTLLRKAGQEGDLKAMELLLRISGEMPSDKVELTGKDGRELLSRLPKLTPEDIEELRKEIE